MVNFMNQMDWAIVPRYLVEHYSGSFDISLEHFFHKILIFKPVDFE